MSSGFDPADELDRRFGPYLGRLVHGEPPLERERLGLWHAKLVASTSGFVWLRHQSDHLVRGVEEGVERRESEFSRAHEKNAHGWSAPRPYQSPWRIFFRIFRLMRSRFNTPSRSRKSFPSRWSISWQNARGEEPFALESELFVLSDPGLSP